MTFSLPPLEPGQAGSASACTCARLRRLTRRMTARYDRELASTGLRLTQYSLLATLQREGAATGLSLSELAAAMDMDRTTLTRNLRPLVDQHFIAVDTDQADRRSRRVTLTDDGRAAVAAARPKWQAAQDHVTAILGAGDVAALHDWIDSVLPAFRGEQPGEDA